MTVLRLAFLLLAFLLGQLIPLVSAAAEDPSRIEVFVRDGCAHCEAARDFIGGLVREQPELQVSIIDVQRNPDALKRLIEISRSEGITQPGVPTILIGKRLIVGFDTAATTGQQ